MEKTFERIMEFKKWEFFILLVLLTGLTLYVINDIIIYDPSYFTGGNKNSVRLYRNVYKVIYAVSPFYLYIKVFLIAHIIRFGVKSHLNIEIPMAKLFLLVIFAQIILLIPDLIQIIWFMLINTDYSMKEVKYFEFISLVNLFDGESIRPSFLLLARTINLFEFIYWFVIISGVSYLCQVPRKEAVKASGIYIGLYLSYLVFLLVVKLAFTDKIFLAG